MEWISVKNYLPTKNGDYLVTVNFLGKHRYMKMVSWANDLNKLDKWNFPADEYKGVSGFYNYDSEWGYYEVDDVVAWCEIEPYEGE